MNSSALESRDHNTGCINSNWWQSTRLKVLQITVIVLQVWASSMLSWDQDRDLGLQVSRPRPRRGQNALESRDHGLDITTLTTDTLNPCHRVSLLSPLFTAYQIFALCAKLSGTVYCYRSCLCVCNERAGVVCVWVCYRDNSKLRASIFIKLGL